MTTPARPRRARTPRPTANVTGITNHRVAEAVVVDMRPVPTEHQEQAEVVAWAEAHRARWPELALMYAVPNFAGHMGGAVARLRAGAKAKREGRKAGVPDLCLPVPRQGKHSLYIEMKRQRGGTVSAEQRAWHIALRDVGHRVEVCRGATAAIEVLTDYLSRAA